MIPHPRPACLLAPGNLRALPAAILFASVAASLSGQTAPSAAPDQSTDQTTPPATPSEQAVTLSAFEVRDTKDSGYFARDSVSGMKTAESLMDSVGNITVVPRDLIDDINDTESASDTLKFVASGVEPFVRGEQMQIRGARTGFTLVDDIPDLMFFADNVGVDTYEVLKGPTAVLYGESPAIFGLVVKTQKKPLPISSTDLTTTVGDGNFRRVTLDTTGPLAEGFSYRLIAAYQKYPNTDPAYWDNRKILIGELQWSDGPNVIRASYEHATIQTGLGNNITMVNDNSGPDVTPYTSPLGRYFYYAPLGFGYYGLYSNDVRLTGLHKFNDNWQTRIFYDRTITDRPSYQEPEMTSYNTVTQTFTLGYFDYDENFISTVYGTDNIGKYEFAGVKFQTNFGYLYNDRDGTNQTFLYLPNWISGSMLAPPPDIHTALPPPDTKGKPNNFTPGPSNSYYALETIRPIPNSDMVILNGGMSRVFVPRVDLQPAASQNVYRAGAVVKVQKDVDVYYSYATRFQPSSFTDVDQFGRQYPNFTGSGHEVGAKCDLFDHRLILTVDYYSLVQGNQIEYTGLISTYTGLGYYVSVGSEKDTGEEFDAQVEPVKNWQLIVVGWEGSDLDSWGIELNGSIKRSAAFFTKYSFTEGWMKNLGVGGGTFYGGRRYYQENSTPGPLPSPTPQYMGSYTVSNLFIDYRFSRHWRASLSMANVFNSYYIEGAWDQAQADYGNPRSFRVTLDFHW